MDHTIDPKIARAIDDLESLLLELNPDAALVTRKAVLMILLRNGLIATSRLRLEEETRAFVAASRLLEDRPALH